MEVGEALYLVGINWDWNSVFPRGEKGSIEIVRCSGRWRTMDRHQNGKAATEGDVVRLLAEVNFISPSTLPSRPFDSVYWAVESPFPIRIWIQVPQSDNFIIKAFSDCLSSWGSLSVEIWKSGGWNWRKINEPNEQNGNLSNPGLLDFLTGKELGSQAPTINSHLLHLEERENWNSKFKI